MHELVAEVFGDAVHRGSRDGPTTVPDVGEQLRSRALDVGEVVVGLPHPGAQLGVRAPCVLGRRRLLAAHRRHRLVHSDECLERLGGQPRSDADARQPERGVRRRPLRTLQTDLEGRSP